MRRASVLSATVGYWIYYLVGFGFQVLFAARFGASEEAAAFVVAYGAGMAVTNLAAGTAQSVLLPRLVGPHGELRSGGLRLLGGLSAAAALPGVACMTFAGRLAGAVHGSVGMSEVAAGDVLWYTGLYAVVQVCVVGFGVVALATGRRFLPAFGPALPVTAGALLLLASPNPSVVQVLQALVAGSALQALVMAAAVRTSVLVVRAPSPGAVSTMLATLAGFGLIALLPPFERALTAHYSAIEAAQYDYAIRCLNAVQQLVIGGVLMTALADWSSLTAMGDRTRVRESVGRAVLFTGVLLALLASLGVIGAQWGVSLLFERGRFGARDTDAVAGLVLLALPGFWAEGVGQVLSRAMLAVQRNWVAIWIGVAHVVLRVALLSALVPIWGGGGTAGAYSIAMIVLLVAQVVLSFRLSLVAWPRTASVWRWAVIGAGTVGTALALAVYARSWAFWVNGLIVVAVFAVLLALLRTVEPLRVGR